MAHLRVVTGKEQTYKNLQVVCAMLNALCKTNTEYRVADCYFDLGQGWLWTTILNNKGVQVLSPREWEEIENATTITKLGIITDEIRAGKYFRE